MTARTSFFDLSAWMKRGFQAPRIFGHLGRVDVLVHVFRVVRLEQLGELLAGVFHEIPRAHCRRVRMTRFPA